MIPRISARRGLEMTKDSHREDMELLRRALEELSETSRSWEQAFRALQDEVARLNRELAEKNRELVYHTEYLSRLLESISDGVIAVDLEGRITRANRAACAVLGYEAEELRAREFETVFGRPFSAEASEVSGRLRTRSGREVAVTERDADIIGEDGRPLGRVKVFQDLSELNALRSQLRQRERLALLGEMSATVAHEIRNPLGGIEGFAGLLALDLADDPERLALVERILDGTRRLDRVVNGLLDYARPVSLRPRAVDCAALVDAAVEQAGPAPAGVALSRAVPEGLRARVDPDHFAQVLINLLLNAFQSLPPEGGAVSVTVREAGAEVVFIVRDTGCGMDEETRQRMFSPFYTTKAQGTGLGLAFSAKIVEAHGGRFEVDSHPGDGTEVRVYLSRAE